METRGLRYFVTVAEELHFGRAAQRLSVSLPVLSRTIRRTEGDLGVELFERDSHDVRLTGSGTLLLGPAREAVSSLADAVADAREAGGQELMGTVSVGFTPLLRHRLGPSILQEFAAAYPRVAISQRLEFGGLLIGELLARRLDVVIGMHPPRHEELSYEPLRAAELAVLLSTGHALADRASVSLADLREEEFQMPSDRASPGLRDRFAQACVAEGFVPKLFATPIDHDETLSRVRQGGAVILASRFYLDTLPSGVAIVPLDPPPDGTVFEIVRRREPAAPELARFIRTARSVARRSYEELG